MSSTEDLHARAEAAGEEAVFLLLRRPDETHYRYRVGNELHGLVQDQLGVVSTAPVVRVYRSVAARLLELGIGLRIVEREELEALAERVGEVARSVDSALGYREKLT